MINLGWHEGLNQKRILGWKLLLSSTIKILNILALVLTTYTESFLLLYNTHSYLHMFIRINSLKLLHTSQTPKPLPSPPPLFFKQMHHSNPFISKIYWLVRSLLHVIWYIPFSLFPYIFAVFIPNSNPYIVVPRNNSIKKDRTVRILMDRWPFQDRKQFMCG